MIQPKTLKSSVMREIRPYTDKHGELSPAIYREEAAPAGFVEVPFIEIINYFIFARENLVSWRAGSCLHEIFLASVGDGLARTRAPGPQAAKLSLCTPEKLVSRDVLAIPSRYRTAFPAVPWVLYCSYLHDSLDTQVNARL